MKNLIFLVFIVFFIACEQDTELSESIYVADTDNPELPSYSEWGYNTFGIKYERNVFIYSNNVVPLKIIADTNYLTFLLQGSMNYEYMALKISIPDSTTSTYKDLIEYNNSVISLGEEGVYVEMIDEDTSYQLKILSGEINFTVIKRLFVDNIEEGLIVSGKFNLKFVKDDIPESMSDGRFDFGVNDAIFFAF